MVNNVLLFHLLKLHISKSGENSEGFHDTTLSQCSCFLGITEKETVNTLISLEKIKFLR